LVEHEEHQRRLGGQRSCTRCHHANARDSRGTSCAACHRDMYSPTDVFAHARHVTALGANASCARCHPPGGDRTATTAAPCVSCHHGWRGRPGEEPAAEPIQRMAAGYRTALHALCIDCHRQEEERRGLEPALSRCDGCHRDLAPPPHQFAERKAQAAEVT
jgi:hypothetical protein